MKAKRIEELGTMFTGKELMQADSVSGLREMLDPTPVKPERIPKWLATRLRTAYRDGRIEPLYEMSAGHKLTARDHLMSAVYREGGNGSWLDHWGETDWYLKSCFVAEPYNFSLEDHQLIDEFAALLDLHYEVSPNSWHYPGETIRILFYGKGQR